MAEGSAEEPILVKCLALPFHHHFLDLGDGLSRVQAFRTRRRAVHDSMAAIEAERIFQIIEPFTFVVVPTIRQPTISLSRTAGPR